MAFRRTGAQLVDAASGRVIAAGLVRAEGALAMTFGLLRCRLGPGEALWLEPCNGVHTWGLRAAIDVIALDRDLTVLRVRAAMRPWRVMWPVRGVRVTVEAPAGAAAGLRPGDRLAAVEAARAAPGV